MEDNGAPELLCFPHSSEYFPLCSAEQRHSYRFGTTWGWVNDDRFFIFGWTIPLKLVLWSRVTYMPWATEYTACWVKCVLWCIVWICEFKYNLDHILIPPSVLYSVILGIQTSIPVVEHISVQQIWVFQWLIQIPISANDWYNTNTLHNLIKFYQQIKCIQHFTQHVDKMYFENKKYLSSIDKDVCRFLEI